MVSAACWLGLSPGPSATAIPPCAQALALSARLSLVSRTTPYPSDASRQAVHRPAIPVPTMTGRSVVMPGNIPSARLRPRAEEQDHPDEQKEGVRRPSGRGRIDHPAGADGLGDLGEQEEDDRGAQADRDADGGARPRRRDGERRAEEG